MTDTDIADSASATSTSYPDTDGMTAFGFLLEDAIVDAVEGFRTRFARLELDMVELGCSPVDEGLFTTIRATWTTDRFDIDHDWGVDHPLQIPVEFHRSYEVSLVDPGAQKRFFDAIRRVYEPLADEGIGLDLHVALPANNTVAVWDGEGSGRPREFDCSAFRTSVESLSEDKWIVLEYGDGLSASTFEFGRAHDAVADVIVLVWVVVSLVPRCADGEYPADPGADLSLAVPLDAATLDEVMSRHAMGLPLDEAVGLATGSPILSY